MNQQVYSKMVSVTQYVHLIMLKRFNTNELDHKCIYFIVSAVLFQRASAHTRFWLAVIFDWFCRVTFGVDTQIACHIVCS